MSLGKQLLSILALFLLPSAGFAVEVRQLHAWRTELERIYHDSRLPPKKPFAEECPPSLIEQLVARDLLKERVLAQVYRVEVTEEMLQEEARRIDRSTRDAAKLARIKAALGRDGSGYLPTVVRPIVVERMLRVHFYQDKTLHAAERAKAMAARRQLAEGGKPDGLEELTWQLGSRPEDDASTNQSLLPPAGMPLSPEHFKKSQAQAALTQGGGSRKTEESKHYFDDLGPELGGVLKKHLQKAGDLSPIVESPAGFGIYQVLEITDAHWKVAVLFIPRQAYEDWLASQGA